MKTYRKNITPGYYIMRNNRFDACSRLGQEVGIVLNKDYYLDTTSFLSTPISMEEAKRYSKILKLNLPTKKLLKLLAANQEIVNNSLIAAGKGNYLLLGDVFKAFWTTRANCKTTEKRRVLFIKPICRN